MSVENRQKIPVPRRSFLWSLNETSGEILTHVGPTEFTPSANDRIVRSNDRGGFEQAPMESRPFVVARDGQYVLLSNPVRVAVQDEGAPNGSWVPGGNKEKDLILGTTRIIPGPCAFPMWPGQSAEVRPAHKLGANHYLLVEVVGPLDETAPYYRLVVESAGLSSAIIDAGDGGGGQARPEQPRQPGSGRPGDEGPRVRLGQRIVIQGRHTQLFIPPSGIEIVPPVEEGTEPKDSDDEGIATLPPPVAQECAKLVAQVREGISNKQFSMLKNELRHRQDLTLAQRAILLTALDAALESRQQVIAAARRGKVGDRSERARAPQDPYARRAVVLGPKEFCILFDADGNPRIVKGPARVFPGPHDTFLQRGSRRRVYDAYELAQHQALWLRIIAPISRERLGTLLPPGVPGIAEGRDSYEAGHELIIRGLPSVFFPFIEAEVIHPQTREPHVGNDHDSVIINAIGIDQKSGIYVRDLRTGMVKMVRGETSYLVDPRSEEHVQRRVPREQWNLAVAHAEPHKASKDESVQTPWALSVTVPNNEACLVTSRVGRRVEVGPRVVLLDFEEQLSTLRLSRGPSKDGRQTVASCFLRVAGGRFADTFDLVSADFVTLRVKLGFAGHFEGDSAAWFQVEDPVKLLADYTRSQLRAAARQKPATHLLKEIDPLVRAVLTPGGPPLKLPDNGMVIDRIDVLGLTITDGTLSDLFSTNQREAVRLQLRDDQSTRRIESERHQDAIDSEEQEILRRSARRRAETGIVDSEATDVVERRKMELGGRIKDLEWQISRSMVEHELAVARERVTEACESRLREADTLAKAARLRDQSDEAHRVVVAEVERETLRVAAQADAERLRAVQPELVAALHGASDSQVLTAAAKNMNLVSLLGGKTPGELLSEVVRGTRLERTAATMLSLADGTAAGAPAAGGSRPNVPTPDGTE